MFGRILLGTVGVVTIVAGAISSKLGVEIVSDTFKSSKK